MVIDGKLKMLRQQPKGAAGRPGIVFDEADFSPADLKPSNKLCRVDSLGGHWKRKPDRLGRWKTTRS